MTEEEILRTLSRIADFVNSGYSLEIARKNTNCNSVNSKRYRIITKRPEYIAILNAYLVKHKINTKYDLIDGKLVGTRRDP